MTALAFTVLLLLAGLPGLPGLALLPLALTGLRRNLLRGRRGWTIRHIIGALSFPSEVPEPSRQEPKHLIFRQQERFRNSSSGERNQELAWTTLHTKKKKKKKKKNRIKK